MFDITKIPDWIKNDLHERGHDDSAIAQMEPRRAFREYCHWNGIIGYDGDLWNAVEALRNAETAPATGGTT